MKKDLVKKLIAGVFIKGEKDFSLSKNKTDLVKKLSETKELKGKISYKTLLNYFDFYFRSGKEVNPNSDIIYTLLKYLGYQTEKQFQNNPPTIDYKDVPFVNGKNMEPRTGQSSTKPQKPWGTIIVSVVVLLAVVITLVVLNPFGDQTKEPEEIEENPKKEKKKPPLEESTVRIYPVKETDFFSATKEPLIWYAKVGDRIECFSAKGNHPETGEELKLVTQEIVDEYIEKYKDIIRFSKVKIVEKGRTNYMMSFYFRDIYRKVYERYTCDGIMRANYDADSLKQDQFIVCHLKMMYTVNSLATKKQLDRDTIFLLGIGTSEPLALKDAIYKLTFE